MSQFETDLSPARARMLPTLLLSLLVLPVFAVYAMAHYVTDGDRLISPQSLAAMQQWTKSDLGNDVEYGLGLYKTAAGPGMTLVGHTGIHNAFSFLWVEQGVLISGSLNQSENHALSQLVFPVVRILRGAGGCVDHPHRGELQTD